MNEPRKETTNTYEGWTTMFGVGVAKKKDKVLKSINKKQKVRRPRRPYRGTCIIPYLFTLDYGGRVTLERIIVTIV